MRQNLKWILLSEVRSAEAVMAARNSISSGHYILSTIHADKAISIPNRMYSLLETSQEIDQFLKSIYRYIQIGVYIRGYQDKETKRFVREIAQVCEFYVTEDNEAKYNVLYQKTPAGKITKKPPSKYLIDYLEAQGVELPDIYKVGSGDTGVSATSTIENENLTAMEAMFEADNKVEEETSQQPIQIEEKTMSPKDIMGDFYTRNKMVKTVNNENQE